MSVTWELWFLRYQIFPVLSPVMCTVPNSHCFKLTLSSFQGHCQAHSGKCTFSKVFILDPSFKLCHWPLLRNDRLMPLIFKKMSANTPDEQPGWWSHGELSGQHPTLRVVKSTRTSAPARAPAFPPHVCPHTEDGGSARRAWTSWVPRGAHSERGSGVSFPGAVCPLRTSACPRRHSSSEAPRPICRMPPSATPSSLLMCSWVLALC